MTRMTGWLTESLALLIGADSAYHVVYAVSTVTLAGASLLRVALRGRH